MTKKSKKLTSISSNADRASGTRVPVQFLVDYKANGSYLFDFCRNLGCGGIFIETKEPRNQGSELELTFTLPDSKKTVSAKGQVMWVQKPIPERPELTPGMGVQFNAFNDENQQQLDEFIKRYSPTSKAS